MFLHSPPEVYVEKGGKNAFLCRPNEMIAMQPNCKKIYDLLFLKLSNALLQNFLSEAVLIFKICFWATTGSPRTKFKKEPAKIKPEDEV